MQRSIFYILFIISQAAFSQTIGGNAAYNFLKLPASPILTAAGGVNVSYRPSEVSLSANNPALLHQDLSSQVNLSFNAFVDGIKTYNLTAAHYSHRLQTTFGGHISYIDYGSAPLADAVGNTSGEFRPVDYVVQFSASRNYLEKWTYGATFKFINSSYGQYKSNALAMDIGVLYFDSAKNLSLSFVAKNMGAQLRSYAGIKEDLPFDLQIGITKKLSKAPFGFSLTAFQLHQFNLQYNDTFFNNENKYSEPSSINKFFNHFVLATHIYMGQNIEATIGYNHLRRQDLSIPDAQNGLTGFSAGLHLKFSKLQVLYARSAYQRGISYNQIGVTAQLNKLIGLGR